MRSRAVSTSSPSTPSRSTGDFQLGFPPLNDNFEAPATYTAASFSRSGELGRATAQAGEPAHGGTAARRSVWFAWTPPRSAAASVDACWYSTARITVYTGSALDALATVTPLPRGTCPSGQSGMRVRWQATAGVTYRIVVDSSSTSISDYYSLSARMAPTNDLLSEAANLSTTEAYLASGTTLDAALEAGEADHAGAGGQASVWYRWTAPRSGTVRLDTCNTSYTNFDTAIALYRLTESTLSPVDANDDTAGCGSSGRGSRIRTRVEAGAAYRIAVTGHGDAEGSFGLALAMGPTNDDFAAARSLGQGTTSGSVTDAGDEPGEPNHGGAGGDRSVWYRFSLSDVRNLELRACPTSGGPRPALAAYTGAELLGLLAAGTATTRTIGGVSCSIVTLRGATGQYSVAVDGLADGEFSLTLAVAPVNDDLGFATTLAGSGRVFGTTSAASAEDGEPLHAGIAGGRSVWYRWTPTVSGPVTLDTCASSLDTLVAVYTLSGTTLTPIVSGDDAAGCGSGGSRVVRDRPTPGSATTSPSTARTAPRASSRCGCRPRTTCSWPRRALSGELAQAGGTIERGTAESGEPAHADGSPRASRSGTAGPRRAPGPSSSRRASRARSTRVWRSTPATR